MTQMKPPPGNPGRFSSGLAGARWHVKQDAPWLLLERADNFGCGSTLVREHRVVGIDGSR